MAGSGPAPSLGSTLAQTLLAEVLMSQPQCCGHGRAVSITLLSCGSMGRGEMNPIFQDNCEDF